MEKKGKNNFFMLFDKTLSNRFLFTTFLVLLILIFVKLLIPYYQHSIYQWDAAGHVAATEYLKEEIFPGVIGWNTQGYMGFPQNQFYPPAYSWITALLSFFVGLEGAFRIIVSFSVLILPFCFYILAREFKLDKAKSLFFAVISLIFLTLPSHWFTKYQFGGNFDSLFEIGLLTNSLGLVFLLFYMVYLPRLKKNKFFILESLLLSLTVLTNMVTGLVAILYSLSYFISEWSGGSKNYLFIKHYIFAFLLSAFWAIPFLIKSGYSTSALIPLTFNLPLFITIIISCICMILLYRRKDFSLVYITVFLASLLVFIFIVHIFEIGFHAYRLVPFFYIFTFLAFTKLVKINKLVLYISIILLALTLFSYSDYKLIDKDYETPLLTNAEGRSLIISTFSNGVNVHLLEHLMPYWNKNLEGVSYIYVESGVNSREVNTLKKFISPGGLVWGTIWNKKNIDDINYIQKEAYLDRSAWLFGLGNIITYAESSSINYESKRLLLSDRINLWHKVYSINGESFYSNGEGFFISRSSKEIYLIDEYKSYKIEISDTSRLFLKDDVLRDEIILCNESSTYLLKKNQIFDYNSYSYTIINDLDVKCIDNNYISEKNDSYSNYNNMSIIKINQMVPVNFNSGEENLWALDYYVYELNKSLIKKVEVLKENVSFVNIGRKEWNEFSYSWFLGSNFSNLYARGEKPMNAQDIGEGEIENLIVEREKIKFYLRGAEGLEPIIIKVSYFPNWKAYQNGNEIPIYELSPHLMLIYSDNGPIEIRYEKIWSDYLGIIFSLISIPILILFYIRGKDA